MYALGGMDYNEIVDPLTPQLRAIDSINPQDEAFPNAIRGGVTTACTGPGSATWWAAPSRC